MGYEEEEVTVKWFLPFRLCDIWMFLECPFQTEFY